MNGTQTENKVHGREARDEHKEAGVIGRTQLPFLSMRFYSAKRREKISKRLMDINDGSQNRP